MSSKAEREQLEQLVDEITALELEELLRFLARAEQLGDMGAEFTARLAGYFRVEELFEEYKEEWGIF